MEPEPLTREWAERLLEIRKTRDATAGESAEIMAFIRENGPLAHELAEAWPLEADQVAFEG